MCASCGCSTDHVHDHAHEHDHVHNHDHVHVRRVSLEEAVLAKNEGVARENRGFLESMGIAAFNFVSSPGAGKTSLLVALIGVLKRRVLVIEGDQETSRDAERIRETGAPAVQINTGTGCHLDAGMVKGAIGELELVAGSLLFIENVGNLVCPALFDLGERAKVVVMSVTEGEDKPLKYPHMFRAARVLVLNKIDLLPYVECDLGRVVENARRINPQIRVFAVSARSGTGLPALADWLGSQSGGLA